jgi:hypothetical protein
MALLETIAGHVLVETLADEIANVQAKFDRGPQTPLNYREEFHRDVTQAQTRKHLRTPRTPEPERGMSL